MSDSGITARERQAIYDNLRQYAWCLDRADGDGVAATFTRDGVIEATGGRQYQSPGGMQEFVRQAATQPGFAGRQHHIQPLLIEKTNDGYLVTSYWMVITWHAGSAPFLVGLGWYRDRCVLEDGRWRFEKKMISRWDSENAPLVRNRGTAPAG